ncbi:MAG: hypothetical protein FD129_20 [bacterium]|nr:MAG: hypothetical protein FD129_20 [bacterium]
MRKPHLRGRERPSERSGHRVDRDPVDKLEQWGKRAQTLRHERHFRNEPADRLGGAGGLGAILGVDRGRFPVGVHEEFAGGEPLHKNGPIRRLLAGEQRLGQGPQILGPVARDLSGFSRQRKVFVGFDGVQQDAERQLAGSELQQDIPPRAKGRMDHRQADGLGGQLMLRRKIRAREHAPRRLRPPLRRGQTDCVAACGLSQGGPEHAKDGGGVLQSARRLQQVPEPLGPDLGPEGLQRRAHRFGCSLEKQGVEVSLMGFPGDVDRASILPGEEVRIDVTRQTELLPGRKKGVEQSGEGLAPVQRKGDDNLGASPQFGELFELLRQPGGALRRLSAKHQPGMVDPIDTDVDAFGRAHDLHSRDHIAAAGYLDGLKGFQEQETFAGDALQGGFNPGTDIGRRRRGLEGLSGRGAVIGPRQDHFRAVAGVVVVDLVAAGQGIQSQTHARRAEDGRICHLIHGDEADPEAADLAGFPRLAAGRHKTDRVEVARPMSAVRIAVGDPIASLRGETAGRERRVVPDDQPIFSDVEPDRRGAGVVCVLEQFERHGLVALKAREHLADVADQIDLVGEFPGALASPHRFHHVAPALSPT